MAKRKNIHVDELYEEAKAGGRKLTASERRRVLVYLDEINEDLSNVELAKLFQVSEKTIRVDRERLLSDFGTQLTPEAQVYFVSRQMRDLEYLISCGKASLKSIISDARGTLGERFYLETLLKLYKERRETLENVGVIRKELGSINVAEEHWVATVKPDTGELNVHQASADEVEADALDEPAA